MDFKTLPIDQMTPRGQRMYNRNKYVLGYKQTEEQPHAEMVDWWAKRTYHLQRKWTTREKGYILVPRNCFKTSDLTIGGIIDSVAEDPNINVLLGSHTHDFSCQILSEIKWHLERNEELKAEIGDVKVGSPKWAEEAITFSTRSINRKEPTIDTCALDKPKVGGHYDLIAIDDIHTRENITPKLLKKARNFLSDLQPLLKPGGVLLLVGTRWHHNDIYGYIQDQDAARVKRGKNPEYASLRRGCYDGPEGLYFPSLLDHDYLDELRANMPDKEFACQYLNEPIEESASVFPASLIQYYDGDYLIVPGKPPYIRTHVREYENA